MWWVNLCLRNSLSLALAGVSEKEARLEVDNI
jgi:hypothetical protein